MRIHHLNCGTLCPFGHRLVCHCLLVETARELVLVDTGLGLGDVADPRRISRFFRHLLRPHLSAAETAARQVEALGFERRDVRHIILTHLDFDHAGGIEDFPGATVHLLAAELAAARQPDSFIARGRYRPTQWDADVAWRVYEARGEPWHGFDCVRELDGLPPGFALIPLVGHTRGHCGVAVATVEGWLLDAGDAYFHHAEMATPPHCTPDLIAYQALMEVSPSARLANQNRLRALVSKQGGEVKVFSAHDARELEELVEGGPALFPGDFTLSPQPEQPDSRG
jgi:glyoxylase-like metal-dependent hydrolase (beta-lactamase superfamily II)